MTQYKRIYILKNGPYRVERGVRLQKEFAVPDKNGDPMEWKPGEVYEVKNRQYLLCRCGKSGIKPFCDWTHADIGFDGMETASRLVYGLMAVTYTGPGMGLMDARPLCASARFCDRLGGTWRLTQLSDSRKARETAIEQACDCPSGRLTAVDKEKGKIEPEFEQSISVVEDMAAGVSGPLWVKGGMEIIGADGKPYERRNRQTLCRCGASENKPFCDGSHIEVKFDDGK